MYRDRSSHHRKGAAPRPRPAYRLLRTLFLVAGLFWLALAPVYAITVSKTDVRNTFVTRSDRQLVNIYGLPPIILSSAATASTTKVYTAPPSTSGAYPYSTSTNSQAKFILPTSGGAQQYINNGEYGSASVSTVDPAAALSISGWSWYLGTSRIGTVPDPSVYRQRAQGGVNAAGQPWIALNVTFANTAKPRQFRSSNPDNPEDPASFPVFVAEEARPTVVLGYPDFGVGAIPLGLTREQEVRTVEQPLSQLATRRINANSKGNLAPPADLVRNCDHRSGKNRPGIPLHPGRSCATYTHTSDFFEPVVPGPGAAGPVPDAKDPVVPVLIGSTADRNGMQPELKFSAGNGKLRHVIMGPGATITFQVRVLAGVVHVPDPSFKVVVLTRMRETSISDMEATRALFTAVMDYPDVVTPGALRPAARAAAAPAAAGVTGPQDRQHWAHLVRIFNRSLQALKRDGDEPLRGPGF